MKRPILFFILQKEFKQIFRNKGMLPIMFIMPVVQLLILSFAATFEMKDIKINIVDNDKTPASRELISKFKGSKFYTIINYTDAYNVAENDLKSNKADVILQIPQYFEKNLIKENASKVKLTINAINGSAAGLVSAYTMSIIKEFNKAMIVETLGMNIEMPVKTNTSYWFNPELDYKTYMVPGILVLLVSIISLFLSSMNIVREKEMGTIEQINVTPILKYQFVAGKLIPFWIIAMFELAIGLTLAKLIFALPMLGNVSIIFLFAGLYILALLGLGLFISTISDTQQQAMFIAWFLMVVFILLSGLFTPVESMPLWAQNLNIINPISYFIKVMRMVLLKGAGLKELSTQFIAMAIYAFISITLAVRMYKKKS